MVEYHSGSVFDTTVPLIAHQVNCKGVMGRGLALQVKSRWPKVFDSYRAACFKHSAHDLLGCIQVCAVTGEKHIRFCANLFGQVNYGTQQRMTNLKALELCFVRLRQWCLDNGIKRLAIPWMIGCGLGGGNWDEVRNMLVKVFADDQVTLEIWKRD